MKKKKKKKKKKKDYSIIFYYFHLLNINKQFCIKGGKDNLSFFLFENFKFLNDL